jgi:hypothetical protein
MYSSYDNNEANFIGPQSYESNQFSPADTNVFQQHLPENVQQQQQQSKEFIVQQQNVNPQNNEFPQPSTELYQEGLINSNDFSLFGPLPGKYCYLFYSLSLISFVLFILTIIGFLVLLINPGKEVTYLTLINVFYVIILYFVIYLQNRILFNMCEK